MISIPVPWRGSDPATAVSLRGRLGFEAVEWNDVDGPFGNLVGIGLGKGHDPALLQAETRHRGPNAAQFAVEVAGRELDPGLHGQDRPVPTQ